MLVQYEHLLFFITSIMDKNLLDKYCVKTSIEAFVV